MTKSSPKTDWLVWGALVGVILLVAGAYVWKSLHNQMLLPVIGQLSSFNLTNQNDQRIDLPDLRGKVCIADVIFTRCPGPCPRMTAHLAEIQAALPSSLPVKLVTLTSDPEFDTPPVLRKYAAQFGVDSNRWWLLTGAKREIQRLAVSDFKFVLVEKKPGEREAPDDMFIHSTWFMLVDQRGQVRGWKDAEGQLHAYFDSEDPVARTKIVAAARQLAAQPAL